MSKTIGNVIDPMEVIEKYGTDAARYYLLREIPTGGDGDFTFERFEQIYQSDLANGLGNLIQRLAVLLSRADVEINEDKRKFNNVVDQKYRDEIERFKLDNVLISIWNRLRTIDRAINEKELWNLGKKELGVESVSLVDRIREIAFLLQPFLPETAEKVRNIFKGPKVKAPEKPLFPRLKS